VQQKASDSIAWNVHVSLLLNSRLLTFRNCYKRIFVTPKQKERRLTKEFRAKHQPKKIPKIELQSGSEDDYSVPKDVSSADEDDSPIDTKIGIKKELQCEPSTSAL
jgi:hypothetical protein